MTNLEKFIEVMNSTFNARFKPENMKLACVPCGALKKSEYACDRFKCDSCKKWWGKEYEDPGKRVETGVLGLDKYEAGKKRGNLKWGRIISFRISASLI